MDSPNRSAIISKQIEPPPDHSPPGYHQVLYWRLSDNRRRVIGLNLLAITMLPIAGLAFSWAAGQIAPAVPSGIRVSGLSFVLMLVGAVVFMILAHEGAHGLFMRAYGARPQFGFEWKLGAAYATAPGHPFRRNQFIVIALAPLVVLTCVGLPLFAVLPTALLPPLLLALTLNAAGAAGDLWMTSICLRYPPSAMIMDERDGIRVFVSPTTRAA